MASRRAVSTRCNAGGTDDDRDRHDPRHARCRLVRRACARRETHFLGLLRRMGARCLRRAIFSFAIPAIVATFSITNADAGLIGTVTLLTSAFGGWFAGILADRFGRVRTLQITVVWFAVFTFLCGFAQTYHQLLAFRALMGLGFGGEWAAGAVLMGEIICACHRGKAVGTVQSGWPVGWAAAAILSTVLFSLLPQETAWRALFWVGLLPAVLVIFIRRFIDDPPVFKAAREQRPATSLASRSRAARDILAADDQDHDPRQPAHHRRAEWLLRAVYLAAHLPQGRAQAVCHRQWWLHRRRHRRLVPRPAVRRLSGGPHRPACQLSFSTRCAR